MSLLGHPERYGEVIKEDNNQRHAKKILILGSGFAGIEVLKRPSLTGHEFPKGYRYQVCITSPLMGASPLPTHTMDKILTHHHRLIL
jgi:hypothetical protein